MGVTVYGGNGVNEKDSDTPIRPNADTSKGVARKISFALLSGILLFCSFPPLEYYAFAWIALIPLVYLCFCSKPGESFLYGLLAGAAFWLASIFWLTRVSFIGWFFVSFYCAGYFACFALVVSWWFNLYRNFKTLDIQRSTSNFERMNLGSTQATPEASPRRVLKVQCWLLKVAGICPSDLIFLFGVPAIWVGLEFVRARFLTGFPWNLLGVSQYTCIPLIQCAEWGGVYLVSCLIVMGNTAFALLIRAFLNERINPEQVRHCGRVEGLIYHRREGILKPAIGLVSFLLILFLALAYGKWQLNRPAEQLESIRTAAVQLNVPQQYKWSEDWADDIYRRLKKSTVAVGKAAPPDLIVWPETALPDFVQYGELSRDAVNETLRHGIPLLIGSMDYKIQPGRTNYYNSSFLFLPGEHPPATLRVAMRAGEAQVYKKRHLVIFGEYVPCARYFPFLRSISGVEEDFMPGTENVVFRLDGKGKKFSVLICFEDTLPYLARECVRAGARMLINQTNDAWFDPLWASRQHMAHCVFRCVENRVACLRATNTGLTCYIDRFGLIRSSLEPLGRESREPCSKAQRILQDEPQIMRSKAEFSQENMPLTFYTRHGDLFALACAAFSLPLFIGVLLNFRSKVRGLGRILKQSS